MKWLRARLSEKTTHAALVGLVAACLPYVHIPENIQLPLSLFIVTFLVPMAVTEG